MKGISRLPIPFFKITSEKSLLRQLNYYGFKILNRNQEFLEYSNSLFIQSKPEMRFLIKKKNVKKPRPENKNLLNIRACILNKEISTKKRSITIYEDNIKAVEMANKDLKQFIINSKTQINNRLQRMTKIAFSFFFNPLKDIELNLYTFALQNTNTQIDKKSQTCVHYKDIVLNIDFFHASIESIVKKVVIAPEYIFNMFEMYFNTTIKTFNEQYNIKDHQELLQTYLNYVNVHVLNNDLRFYTNVEELVDFLYKYFQDFTKTGDINNLPAITKLCPKFIKHDEHGNRVYDMGQDSLQNGYVSKNVFTETYSLNTFNMLFQD